jgi:hypothetical protein
MSTNWKTKNMQIKISAWRMLKRNLPETIIKLVQVKTKGFLELKR